MAGDTGPQVNALTCPHCGANIPPGSTGQMICSYCGSTLVLAPQQDPDDRVRVVDGMRLQAHTITDVQGTGLELLRLLVPVGWEVHGGCQWNLQNPAAPAMVGFQVLNPQGVEGFELLPTINCIDMPGGMGLLGGLTGGQYHGAHVSPVMSASDALRELAVPIYRGGVEGLEIIEEEPLPGVAEELAAVNPGSLAPGEHDAAKARISYTWQGEAMEEEVMCVVQAVPQNSGGFGGFLGMGGPTPWFVDYLFAIRAREGQLDALSGLFDVLIRSVKLNPEWFAAFARIQQQLVGGYIQHQQQLTQIAMQHSQEMNQISDQMYDGWRERQSAMDRISESWSEATRGVDSYTDPNSDYAVELPGGYEHAWSNALGEYVVTNDHNFDPNLSSTVDWAPMQRR